MALSGEGDGAPVAAALDADSRLRRLNGALVFGGCALVVAVLYWMQAVLIPIALAVLLSFLLSPLVRAFERVRFGRVGSVAIVVVLAFGILGGVGFALFTQVTRLADELPGYRSNIRAKVVDVKGATSGGLIDKVRRAGAEVMSSVDRRPPAPARRLEPGGEAPVPVVMQSSMLWRIPSLLEGIASAGLVLVLVIFMLLERRDMRDRLIRLIGYGRLAVTTRALDEAAARISRYLVAQSLLNAAYGFTVGVGLYLLGVPYALLWGFLAALLRFIPYVGAFLGAAMPIVLSLAAFPGWRVPLLVAALFAVCELTTNMIVEPLAYGQSAGVSQVALLAAVAFWTWLWGAIGLVLATPLTVCLVVLSKNVPELRFIFFLLADEEVLEPDVRLYQRLLAADDEEALEVVADYRATNPECDAYDELLVPVLARTSVDRASLRLSQDEEQRMLRAARRLLATMTVRDDRGASPRVVDGEGATGPITTVLGCPATGPGDALALQALGHKLAADGVVVETLWSSAGSLEVLATVEATHPQAVCIAALPPRGAIAARYLCRRVRRQFPEIPLVALLLGGNDDASTIAALRRAGATVVVDSCCGAREALLGLVTAVAEPRVAV